MEHTDDTRQVFEPAAMARAYYWTQGQPFLVNALARKSVMELVTDPLRAITAAHIDEAKELLIRLGQLRNGREGAEADLEAAAMDRHGGAGRKCAAALWWIAQGPDQQTTSQIVPRC